MCLSLSLSQELSWTPDGKRLRLLSKAHSYVLKAKDFSAGGPITLLWKDQRKSLQSAYTKLTRDGNIKLWFNKVGGPI